MDIHIFDITQEDILVSETTKQETTPEQAFDDAVEAARRALAEATAADERARTARVAAVRARPAGMTTQEVARRINRGR